MRDLTEFSYAEWLRLQPLIEGFKQLRNDTTQNIFLEKRPHGLEKFLSDIAPLKGKNILQIIAFEQPEVLDFSIKMVRRHAADATLLVFDNSRRISIRVEIERVCCERNVPYLALPTNPSRHPNRSHGMAMTWIWHNVVKIIRPAASGFIDHDMIPLEKIELGKNLSSQPFYGVPMVGKWGWSLWAGYCVYDFAALDELPFNFLNDFSRGLDTGGRNWNCLYKNYDHRKLKFAEWQLFDAMDPLTNSPRQIEIIDGCWFHIGRGSRDASHHQHLDFYGQITQAIEEGANWRQIQAAIGGSSGLQPTGKEFIAKSNWPRWRKTSF